MARPVPRLVLHALAVFQIVAALFLVAVVAFLLAGTVPTLFGYESYVVYSGSYGAHHPRRRHRRRRAGQSRQAQTPATSSPSGLRKTPTRSSPIACRTSTRSSGHLTFQTKGDANDTPDQVSVDQGALLGKVAYSLPGPRLPGRVLQEHQGKMLMIVVPGVLLVLDYLRERLDRHKQGVRRNAGQASLGIAARSPCWTAAIAPCWPAMVSWPPSRRRRPRAGAPQPGGMALESPRYRRPGHRDHAIENGIFNPGAARLAAALSALQPEREHAAAA